MLERKKIIGASHDVPDEKPERREDFPVRTEPTPLRRKREQQPMPGKLPPVRVSEVVPA